MEEYNSSGERLYRDSDDIKCNIRGMIRREPEWVASTYTHMGKQIADLKAQLDAAESQVLIQQNWKEKYSGELYAANAKVAELELAYADAKDHEAVYRKQLDHERKASRKLAEGVLRGFKSLERPSVEKILEQARAEG